MGYVGPVVAYLSGSVFLGVGIYLVLTGSFPGWWRRRLLWPLGSPTAPAAQLMGAAAILIGASVLAVGFSLIVPDVAGGILVLVAIAAYVLGLILYVLSTWVSRRHTA